MIKPMLCAMGDEKDVQKFAKKGWYFEPKLDGTRAILYKDGNNFWMINRRNRRIEERYPEFKDFLNGIKAKKCILDGEVVVFNKEGLPDFGLLQSREQAGNKIAIIAKSIQIPATFSAFDILEIDEKPLLDKPLSERKKILEKKVKEGNHILLCIYTFHGDKLWDIIKERKMEGVIVKDPNSKYSPGKRGPAWVKIKYLKTIDAIIVGYTHEKRSLSAIAIGLIEDGNIRYLGKVGTGFSDFEIREIQEKLIHIEKVPVYNPPTNEKIYWVKPELVAEVRFLLVTKDMQLRAPAFLRLRDDKDSSDCTIDQIMKIAKGSRDV